MLGGEIGAALFAIESGAKQLRTAWMVRDDLDVEKARELVARAEYIRDEAEKRANRPGETR